MSRHRHNTRSTAIYLLGLATFAACVDPFSLDSTPVGAGGAPVSSGTNGVAGAMAGAPVNSGGGGSSGGGAGSGGTGSAAGGSSGASLGTSGSMHPDASAGSSGSSAEAGVVDSGGGGAKTDASGSKIDGGNAGTLVREAGVDGAPRRDAGPVVALPAPPIRDCPPDPPIPDGGSLSCPANLRDIANWFPITPPMDANGGCRPAPHPAGECFFYQHSWHEFLIATQPDAQGRPAFLSWNTIENTFGAGAGAPSPAIPYIGAGVTQAGGRQVVIDQNGHAVYYGMHMNPAFVNFVQANRLTSADAISAADPNLTFPSTLAMVETKEAWTVVSGAVPANFITTQAMVPTLHIDPATSQVVVDEANPRLVTLQLIAIQSSSGRAFSTPTPSSGSAIWPRAHPTFRPRPSRRESVRRVTFCMLRIRLWPMRIGGC
jgi:hypothetical protein